MTLRNAVNQAWLELGTCWDELRSAFMPPMTDTVRAPHLHATLLETRLLLSATPAPVDVAEVEPDSAALASAATADPATSSDSSGADASSADADSTSASLAPDAEPDALPLADTTDTDSAPPESSTELTGDPADDHGDAFFLLEVDPEESGFSILGTDDPPVANPDAYAVDEDAVLTVPVDSGLLANDVDVDGDALTAELVTGPQHGTLLLNSDGAFVYVPDANYFGTDSFTYRAVNASTASAPVEVTLTVSPVNDAPSAVHHEFQTFTNTLLNVPAQQGLLTSASDVDGPALSAVLVTAPRFGTLNLSPDGSFRYQPAAGFDGNVLFTYRVTDGQAHSSVHTVLIAVELDIAGAVAPSASEFAPQISRDFSNDDSENSLDGVLVGTNLTISSPEPERITLRDARELRRSDLSAVRPLLHARLVLSGVVTLDDLPSPFHQIASAFAASAHGGNRGTTAWRTENAIDGLAENIDRDDFAPDGPLDSFEDWSLLPPPQLNFQHLWTELEHVRVTTVEQLDFEIGLAAGTASVFTTSLTVGYLLWAVRGGSLLASVASTLPAWRLLDPLPILYQPMTGSSPKDTSLLDLVQTLPKINESLHDSHTNR